MESRGYALGREHVDVGRQGLVETVAQGVGRHHCRKVEVGHLAECVNAGIRASGSVGVGPAHAQGIAHRSMELALNRPGVVLDLPAAVARAGVLQGQFVSGHER
jgi:hypothetical protein